MGGLGARPVRKGAAARSRVAPGPRGPAVGGHAAQLPAGSGAGGCRFHPGQAACRRCAPRTSCQGRTHGHKRAWCGMQPGGRHCQGPPPCAPRRLCGCMPRALTRASLQAASRPCTRGRPAPRLRPCAAPPAGCRAAGGIEGCGGLARVRFPPPVSPSPCRGPQQQRGGAARPARGAGRLTGGLKRASGPSTS